MKLRLAALVAVSLAMGFAMLPSVGSNTGPDAAAGQTDPASSVAVPAIFVRAPDVSIGQLLATLPR